MTVITTSSRGPKGADGSDGQAGATGGVGSAGTSGVSILYYDDTITDNATNAIVALTTYTIPAATLAAKGDALRLEASLGLSNNTGDAGLGVKPSSVGYEPTVESFY